TLIAMLASARDGYSFLALFLHGLRIDGKLGAEGRYIGAHAVLHRKIGQIIENVANPMGDLRCLLLFHASGSHRRSTYAYAAGDEWRLRIGGHRIFVDSNADRLERGIRRLARKTFMNQADQK